MHRQCEAYDDYQSKCFIFIYSDNKNYVEKWKNKKLIEWKTTNISIVHLQNRSIPINHHSLIIESKNRLHRQCEAYDDYRLKCFIFIHSYHFFQLKIFDLEKKREKKRQKKRQIIKKRQIKKIKKSHEKQQISYLFIYRIKWLQSYTINHYTNQKIDCTDSVRRMMTIGSNTPLFITMKNKIKPKKQWKLLSYTYNTH